MTSTTDGATEVATTGAARGAIPAPVVAFRHADIGYEGRAVVAGLDLRVDAGEVIGLLGPNGSGKTTLVRGLLGLAPVLRGSVELFGVSRPRFRDWGRVGYVPQRQTIGGGIPSTVREVVASGRLTSVRPFRFARAADRAEVAEAIEAVGLADQAAATVSTLSGGQQRRVLIARALASAPELLVLDEPTAGVDSANQVALAGTLAELARRGTTIVLITHELGPAEPLVTRTIVLRSGRIVHDGAASEAPDEHDDDWHHHHGDPPVRRSGLGLEGPYT
ncbi:MAG: znuC [Acidimicrobiales bacterium]|nr:znuC [Acidimicrobiales bacterium]